MPIEEGHKRRVVGADIVYHFIHINRSLFSMVQQHMKSNGEY